MNGYAIKQSLKNGLIVVVEFESSNRTIARAVFKGFEKHSDNVKTIYGSVYPKQVFGFKTFTEAQKFIDETAK